MRRYFRVRALRWFSRKSLNAGRRLSLWSWRRMLINLPDEELDACLSEAGISRAELFSPARTKSGYLQRMSRMMRHFKVDRDEVRPRYHGALREAERVCAHCMNVGRCRRWLEWGRSNDAPRVFCPNAELWDEIAAQQQKAAGLK